MSVSQSSQILAHLQGGKAITPLLALAEYDCFRLGARIHDLKAQGHDINKQMIETPSGKRVAEYWMEKD